MTIFFYIYSINQVHQLAADVKYLYIIKGTIMNKNKTQFHFTMVELLITIGIIGILASLLVPVLGKTRDSATTVQCKNNLRQLALGFEMYRNEYEQYQIPSRLPVPNQNDDPWAAALARMYDCSDAVLECPGGVNDGTDLWGAEEISCRFWVQQWNKAGNPRDGLGAPRLCGYTVSAYCSGDVDSLGYRSAYKLNVNAISRPTSEVIQAMDGTAYLLYPAESDEHRMSWQSNAKAGDRHGNRLNCLFFDGHVADMEVSGKNNPRITSSVLDMYRINKNKQ